MIYFIKGTVDRVLIDSVVIENSAGIGYEVFCNSKITSFIKEGESIKLITYTHIVQDNITLYGFRDERELNLFKMIIKVNGVGCRMALSIMEVDQNTFVQAILKDNVKELTKIKGVGVKTAQRIIIELKNSVKNISFEINESIENEDTMDVKYALIALGYSKDVVEESIKNISTDNSVDDMIKEALRYINR